MKTLLMKQTSLRNPEGQEGGGGGGSPAPASPDQSGDLFDPGQDGEGTPHVEGSAQPGQEAGTQPSGSGQQPVKPGQGLNLSAEQLQAIVQRSYELAQQNAPAPAAPPVAPQKMTDAEFEAYFGVPKTDENLYVAMFGMKPEKPDQLKSMHGWGQGLVKQAVKMAQFAFQNEIARIRQEYAPMLQQVRQNSESASEARFFAANKDLADPGLRPLLISIRDSARARGQKFPNEQAAHQFLATQAKSIMATIRGGQGAAPGSGPTNGGKMTPTGMGGQSSHGRGPTGQPQGMSKVMQESHDVFA